MNRLTSLIHPVQIGGILALSLAAVGCGSSVDHDSAVKVMNLALTGTVAADNQTVSVNLNPNGGTVTASLTNLLGTGTATVDGSLTHKGTLTTSSLVVALDDWSDPQQSIKLTGSLHESGSFSSQLPLLGDVKLTGALQSTGDINASVDFDLEGTYSLNGFKVTGDVGGQSLGTIQVTL